MSTPAAEGHLPDWEAFYRDYRKPGYVPGFELTTKLGGGMFGLVYRARKQSIGKDYAIKFLQVDDTEVRRAVLAELEQVKYFAQIDHPNLVSIEDRGEVDGIPYLVMSFAGTETLRDRMPGTGKPPTAAERDELVRYFLQCCRGLVALHERSLVHFDIKPANVFLKGAVARLGDYGLSKLVTHSRGSLSMGRGTPYYMAPEMLQRRGDARSDIYSLGVMLYEILCGKVPFTGDSEWEVLRKHEKEAPVLPAHLSVVERSVLQRCLQKDPAARFASVNDVIAAFDVASYAADTAMDVVPAAATPPPLPAAGTADLPPCVPPPLPRRLPPRVSPPPASRARQQPQRTWGFGTVLLAGAMLLAAMVWFTAAPRSSSGVAASAPAPSRTTVSVATGNSIAARLEQVVAGVHKRVRTTLQRGQVPTLKSVDLSQFSPPPDFGSYHDLLAAFAAAPAYSPGQARRLEQWGRPAFLAGVALLQELDYEAADDCKRAAILQQLLASMTAIEGLSLEAVPDEPSSDDIRRFTVIADGWRQLAEQFAKDDAEFQRLLVAKGRVATGVQR